MYSVFVFLDLQIPAAYNIRVWEAF